MMLPRLPSISLSANISLLTVIANPILSSRDSTPFLLLVSLLFGSVTVSPLCLRLIMTPC